MLKKIDIILLLLILLIFISIINNNNLIYLLFLNFIILFIINLLYMKKCYLINFKNILNIKYNKNLRNITCYLIIILILLGFFICYKIYNIIL